MTPEDQTTMRALLLEVPSQPAELTVTDVARPRHGEGEALVELRAAAVNRSDVLNAIGMMPMTVLPRIPGRDFSGVVVAGPDELIGNEVWGTGGNELGFRRDGSHADQMSAPVEALVPLPAAMSLEEAGAAGLSYAIASDGLAAAGLEAGAGQSVLVTGAAGGVGAAALAIAGWRGGRLFAAVLDEEERDLVLAAHPEAEVFTAGEDLGEKIRAATDGAGVEIVYDTVGTPIFTAAIGCLGHRGRMVVITAAPGVEVPFDLFGFYRGAATLMTANSGQAGCVWAAGLLRELLPGFESGALKPPRIGHRFSLEECVGAYETTQNGARGRVLLTFGG